MPNQNQQVPKHPVSYTDIPYSAEAEQAIIGAVLTNPASYPRLADTIQARDFFLVRYQHIWNAIGTASARDEQFDYLTVSEALRETGHLNTAGGISHLMKLINQTPTSAHADIYAGLVLRLSVRRAVLTALNKSISTMLDESQPLEVAMESVLARVRSATLRGMSHSDQSMQEVMSEVFAQVEQRIGNQNEFFLPSGFRDFDRFTAGLERSDLTVIGGKPNMGKTALALGMAINMARLGLRVGMISNEMANRRLGMRMAAMETGINLQALKRGEITDGEMSRFVEGIGRLSDLPIEFDYIPQTTIAQVHGKILRWQRERGLDVLFIDGLWRMTALEFRGDQRQRNEVNGWLTQGLADIAKKTNIAIVVTHQLTKAIDNRQDKRPTKGDLEYGGKVDMNADLIVLIYRDEIYNPTTPLAGQAEIIIDKNRDGPTGSIFLRFDKKSTRFLDAIQQPVDLASNRSRPFVQQEIRHERANPDR